MTKCYRVLFQTYDKSNPSQTLTEQSVLESDIVAPTIVKAVVLRP